VTVLFHPEFAQDILRFEAEYSRISPGLAGRFRAEIESGVEVITRSPGAAGHFVHCGSKVIDQLRRRNLRSFPFFILYGCAAERLIFGSVIPSRSDPLTWLARFSDPNTIP
jgi:hypothetical protein